MGSHDRTLSGENRTSGPKENYTNRVIVDSRAGPLQLQRQKNSLFLELPREEEGLHNRASQSMSGEGRRQNSKSWLLQGLGTWLVRAPGWGRGSGLSCNPKAGLLIHTVQKQGGGVG